MTDEIEPFYEDEERPEVKGPWRVENLSDLDWALRRLAQLEAEADAIRDLSDAELGRIGSRADSLAAKFNRGVAFFEAKIEEYAHSHKKQLLTGTARSRDFLHGRLGWRVCPGHLVVSNKEALAKWLASQEDETLYRKRIAPDMDALNALHDRDGTVPPGCEYKQAEDVFYVTPLTLEEPPK
jgi:phage host-nuclease inhibitor protein Gam